MCGSKNAAVPPTEPDLFRCEDCGAHFTDEHESPEDE